MLYDAKFIICDNKDIYYRNIYLFIERVLNIIITKSVELIKINLNTCLCNIVFI